jgi:alkylation response protein AidB-like acyl-CoA dehydrogenase
VLNGAKNFITHGLSGNVAVVIARTGEPNTSRNATAFIVERGTPGFSGGRKEDKLGMRASETAEILFQDCRIPDSHRLGEVGRRFCAIPEGARRRTYFYCCIKFGDCLWRV